MKKIICALSALIAGVVLAVDWPGDVLSKIEAAEAAWPSAVTSSPYALAAAIPTATYRDSGALMVVCDSFTVWLFETSGIAFDSDQASGFRILVR